MKERLQSFAAGQNLIIGVCTAERMDYLYPILQAVQTPFVNCGSHKRVDPLLTMPDAKSVIVIGAGCGNLCLPPEDGRPRGELSCIAVGRDYHLRLREHLEELAAFIGPHKFKILVDSGGLNERALAVRAGLGFIGRNGFVISKKFGSLFNIGILLTDLEIEPDAPITGTCGHCRKCIDACASSALTERGFAPELCASYLTQKKGELTEQERRIVGKHLYGCDDCQSCCPRNTGKTQPCTTDEKYPRLDEILKMDESEFKARYCENALYWRGLENFKRNARYAVYTETRKH